MAEFPALPLWTDAYLADTTHLGATEHGAYLLLLISAWRSPGCRLPDDDAKLMKFAKLRPEQWKRYRDILAEFFEVRDGYWYQGRLSDEHAYMRKQSKTASAKGRRGAAKRWGSVKSKPEQTEMPLDETSSGVHRTPPSRGLRSGGYEDFRSEPNPLNNHDAAIAVASSGQCPTDSNPDPTQSPIVDDVDDEREKQKITSLDPMALAEHLTRIAGVSNVGEKRIVSNVEQVREWLDLGTDPAIMERVIVKVRDAEERTIHSLKFFNAYVRREFAKRIYPKEAAAFVKQIVDPKLKRYVEQKIEAPPDTVPIPDEEITGWSQQARDVALRQGWITRAQHRKASQGP